MKKRGLVSTDASLHGLRHQFGTQAVANGAPIKLVAQALGHASVTTTERYYCSISGEVEAIRAAAQKAVS
jgi:integrase/recombinase XerC